MDHTRALGTPSAGGKDRGLLYPLLLIAAIAVITFSVIGIAAMMGVLPELGVDRGAQSAMTGFASSAHRAAGWASDSTSCLDCGTVSTIRARERVSAAGGAAGAVKSAAARPGSERAPRTARPAAAAVAPERSYEIRVQMDDGSYRTFFEQAQPAFAIGQKVRVTDDGLIGR